MASVLFRGGGLPVPRRQRSDRPVRGDAVTNKLQSLVNNAESGVDTLRANLTAYGTSHSGSVGAFVANDLAAKIGIGKGGALEAIDTASGLVGLAHNVSELANPATYIFDPQSNISRLKTTASALTTLDEVTMAVSLSPQVGYTLAKSYAGQLYQNFQKDPPKSAGRLGFEAGTILAGGPLVKVGKVSDGLNTLEQAQNVVSGLDRTAGLVPSSDAGITQSVGNLRSLGLKDAHHVIQDAAVRDLPGYNTKLAPGVQLEGPSTLEGSPHFNATKAQRVVGGGTYGAERQIAYNALISAGYTDTQATKAIQEADAYFKSLGVTENTPTRIPGNRPR